MLQNSPWPYLLIVLMFSSNIRPPLFRVLQGRREFCLTCLFSTKHCHLVFECATTLAFLVSCTSVLYCSEEGGGNGALLMLLLVEMHWRDDFNEGNVQVLFKCAFCPNINRVLGKEMWLNVDPQYQFFLHCANASLCVNCLWAIYIENSLS